MTTKTDADGRYELSDLHPHAAIGMATKRGLRLAGIPLIQGEDRSHTLYESSEPIPPEAQIKLTAADAKRKAAAKTMVNQLLATRRDSSYFNEKLLLMLAAADQEAAIAEANRSKSADAKAKVFAKLGKVQEAYFAVEGVGDPYSRCRARVEVAKLVDDENVWRELLSGALLDSEQAGNPDRRLISLTMVGEAFLEKGDAEYAKLIISSQLPQAKELSTEGWAAYARSSFAESFARYDLDAAIELVKEVEEDDQERHFRNMAHRIAATNPEGAEKARKHLRDSRLTSVGWTT